MKLDTVNLARATKAELSENVNSIKKLLILPSTPDVVTAKEAATTLKVGRTTMYRLIREGKIIHIKIGRKILIPKAYLQSFIESNVQI